MIAWFQRILVSCWRSPIARVISRAWSKSVRATAGSRMFAVGHPQPFHNQLLGIRVADLAGQLQRRFEHAPRRGRLTRGQKRVSEVVEGIDLPCLVPELATELHGLFQVSDGTLRDRPR